MHFCADEFLALLATFPVLRWLVLRLGVLRCRRHMPKAAPATNACVFDECSAPYLRGVHELETRPPPAWARKATP